MNNPNDAVVMATIAVLQRKWDANTLSEHDTEVLHRLKVASGDGYSLLVHHALRAAPGNVSPNGSVDVEPAIRWLCNTTGLDPEEFITNFLAMATERSVAIEYRADD